MVIDILEKSNQLARKHHIETCRKCSHIYEDDFCTIFQKSIKHTSFECDGTDEKIETIL